MIRFLVMRLAGAVAVLLVVSFLVFSLLALSPGSLVATLLGTAQSTPALVAGIKAKYHLDDPFVVQYGHWLGGALRLDFGDSVRSGGSVTHVLAQSLPVSLELAACALVIVVLIGIPLGMAAGMRRGSALDRVVSVAATFSMSAPAYAVGLLLIFVFGVQLSWLPVFGAGHGFGDRLAHLTLPAIALAAMLLAVVLRQTRAAVLETMSQDYVTFARARGLSRRRVLIRYALRNAALPIATSSGVVLITALSGAVIVENVFSIPGVGTLLVQSVTMKDVPVVQCVAMFAGVFVIVVNLLVDLASMLLDPRARREGERDR